MSSTDDELDRYRRMRDELSANLKDVQGHIRRLRQLKRAAEESDASKRRRTNELRRRDKLAAIPELEAQIAALRKQLRSQLMWEEALPGPYEPVRKEPPEHLTGKERIYFKQNALGKYKTALANWLPEERDRLQKIVDSLPRFD
jgi:chromosome segregation ATPase